jgi:hypothetical protein
MSSKLKQVVKSMEDTRKHSADPLRELRHWRLQAERRFMGVILQASQVSAPKGPGK